MTPVIPMTVSVHVYELHAGGVVQGGFWKSEAPRQNFQFWSLDCLCHVPV